MGELRVEIKHPVGKKRAPYLWMYREYEFGEDLSPAEARDLAAKLLAMADELDALTPPVAQGLHCVFLSIDRFGVRNW